MLDARELDHPNRPPRAPADTLRTIQRSVPPTVVLHSESVESVTPCLQRCGGAFRTQPTRSRASAKRERPKDRPGTACEGSGKGVRRSVWTVRPCFGRRSRHVLVLAREQPSAPRSRSLQRRPGLERSEAGVGGYVGYGGYDATQAVLPLAEATRHGSSSAVQAARRTGTAETVHARDVPGGTPQRRDSYGVTSRSSRWRSARGRAAPRSP